MKKKWQLNITLKMFAIFSMIPVVFSSFFSGYNVISSGLQVNAPVSVSVFDYVAQKDVFLSLAFVSIVLMVLLILAITILSMVDVYRKQNTNFYGMMLSIFEIILSVLIFVSTLIYCIKNSVYTDTTSLVYELGSCTILSFVFGLISGVLYLISYTIKIEFKKKKPPVANKKIENS